MDSSPGPDINIPNLRGDFLANESTAKSISKTRRSRRLRLYLLKTMRESEVNERADCCLNYFFKLLCGELCQPISAAFVKLRAARPCSTWNGKIIGRTCARFNPANEYRRVFVIEERRRISPSSPSKSDGNARLDVVGRTNW